MSGYYSGIIDEDALNATQADYDPLFRMRRPTGAPPPMERENETAYRRRLAEALQQHAPNCKGFNIRHSTGSALMFWRNKLNLTRSGRRSIRLRYQKGR